MSTNDPVPGGTATAGPSGDATSGPPRLAAAAGHLLTGAAGTVAAAAGTAAAWCDRCGEPAGGGDHASCRVARALEPPRFCAHCRRRMKVQVLPVGWSAVCVEHGETRG